VDKSGAEQLQNYLIKKYQTKWNWSFENFFFENRNFSWESPLKYLQSK
jgi:hypothetical protein